MGTNCRAVHFVLLACNKAVFASDCCALCLAAFRFVCVNIMESLKLWLALTPPQFEALNKGEMVEPDEYSKRFGLRKTPEAAIERAKYFMEWTPRDVPEKEKRDPKEYVLVEVELTALGYMQKCEAGILLKYKPNEYRWQGNMQALEYDSMGRLLYRFGSEAFAVE